MSNYIYGGAHCKKLLLTYLETSCTPGVNARPPHCFSALWPLNSCAQTCRNAAQFACRTQTPYLDFMICVFRIACTSTQCHPCPITLKGITRGLTGAAVCCRGETLPGGDLFWPSSKVTRLFSLDDLSVAPSSRFASHLLSCECLNSGSFSSSVALGRVSASLFRQRATRLHSPCSSRGEARTMRETAAAPSDKPRRVSLDANAAEYPLKRAVPDNRQRQQQHCFIPYTV